MPELPYYQQILDNTVNTDNLGESAYLYRELLKLYRNGYNLSYEGFESDLVDQLVDGNLLGSSSGTIGKLRSPYVTNDHSKYTVQSAWGPRNLALEGYKHHALQWHNGMDLSAGLGVPCVAIAPGVIRGAVKDGCNRVVVHHDILPSTGASGFTVYLHMDHISVVTGQTVTAGQILGREGAVGAYGKVHLHFEVRDANGYSVDPALHLDLTAANKAENQKFVDRWKRLLPVSQYHAKAPSTDPFTS